MSGKFGARRECGTVAGVWGGGTVTVGRGRLWIFFTEL